MKSKLLLWLLLLCSGSAWAQLPVTESFEATNGDYGYTSNTFIRNTVSPSTEYFFRAQNTVPGFGNPAGSANMANVNGTYFWACEGIRSRTSNSAPDAGSVPGIVTLNAINNTQNFTNLKVIVAAGDPRSSTNIARQTDHLRVQYSYGSDTGPYTTLFEFTGTTVGGTSPWTRVPVNGTNVTGTATILTSSFSDHESTIPAGAGALYVRIEADYNGAQKELAFDNIRVTGTASTVVKPTITSTVGTSTLTFAEGTATPLTVFSGLTVGNPAMTSNPTLTGATVSFTPYAGVQDEVTYTIPAGSGITLSSNTNGVLTFANSSSVGNYEALLESIKYKNTEVSNATAGDRTFTFVVRDGATESIPLSRIINVTTAINGTSLLPRFENFDSDGEGTRYASNTKTITLSGTTLGFMRLMGVVGGSASPGSTYGSSSTFTNLQGTGYWYSNGTKNIVTGNIGIVKLAPVNTTGFVNLHFKIKAGAGAGVFASADFLRFSYSLDGGQTWTVFANYFGSDNAGQGQLRLNGVAANPALSRAAADLDFALPAAVAGTAVEFRVETALDADEIVFDDIQITGTQPPTVTTAAATSVTATSAVLGGSVTADGGDGVSERGVVYSTTNTTPTTSDTKNTNGTGTGSFSETITGLTAGTTYYVRAYAINSAGTGYGSVVSFTTLNVPTVTTAAASSITTTSAVLGGSVTADGGTAVSERGVVYSTTNTTPTTSDTKAANGTGTGSFSQTILGLTSRTTYYVRAYAINSTGTAYGAVQTFTTLNSAPVVTTTGGTTTFIIGGGPVAIDNGLTVTDADNTTLASVRIRIISGLLSGQDVLSFTNTNSTTFGNIGSAASANGTLTLTSSGATATLAQFQAALRTVTFNNSAGTGPTTVRTVEFVANDGTTDSAPATKTVTPAPPTTVVSVTRLNPSPTATAQVAFRVIFSSSVSGISTTNFTPTGSVSGAAVSSVSGSGATYTVTVNTGTGNGTLGLNVQNSTGISPTVTNVPYTSGEQYTIIKNFAAAPQLVLQTGGSASGGFNDVTAFVDLAQVLQNGTSTVVAGGLQNGSFETNNVNAGSFRYANTVVAAPWSFSGNTGVSRNGSGGFGSTASQGDAAGLLQTSGGNGGSIAQNLAVPTGSYQVNFLAVQRNNNGPSDQVVNVFLVEGANNVFIGATQPPSSTTYSPFTSATFNVTAPALTATVSTTSASPTSTSPIPFAVTFSQSVGTTFTAADVTVTGGTLTAGSFAGSGSGPYTFTVTPTGSGTVTVSLAAGIANDANNTLNSASNSLSVQYSQPVTAAPVVTTPANVTLINTSTPTYSGTAPAGSTVTVYLDGTSIGTTTANASGNWNFTQPTALSQGTHTIYATAQTSGSSVSANSNVNGFTVDSVPPTVAISSSAGASGSTTSTSPIPFTVTFSEAVTGFVAGDVTVSNGTISGFTPVSGTTYTFNVTPTTPGTATTVNVPANVALDAALNGNTAAPAAYSLTFTAPTIAVAPATLPNGTVASAYSQTLTASGSTAPYSFAVTAGALPTGLTLTLAGVLSGTPTASGPFTFTVTATDASAAPGPYNGSRSYSVTIGSQSVTAAPVVTYPTNGDLFNTNTPVYGGNTPVGSTVTVYVDGTSIGTTTASSSGTFALVQPTGLTNGVHTVYATAQTSGSAVSAHSNTNTFTVDLVRPTVDISSTAGASGSSTSTTPVPFTVTFSEAVTGFVASDVTLTNGILSGFTGSGTTYTFTVMPTLAGTATTVDVAYDVARDQAGNGNTAATQYSIIYTAPVTAVTWNGSISTDWFTAGNWTPTQLPSATLDATIPAGRPNMPAITASTANAKNLTVNAGATLSQTGGILALAANLTNNGTFQPTGGTVTLGTSTLASILGSSNTRFWNLSIGTNGAQSSTSASTSVQQLFTLNGNFATNGNPLTMESNATNTAMVVNTGSNAISGNVTVQRYIAPDLNAGLGYRHYSAPVSTATVGSLATGSFTPVVNGAYNTSATPTAETPFPTVYGYNQARLATATNNLAPFDKGWFSPNALGDVLAVGQGYTVNLAANQTLSVTGPQNNGNVPLTLSRNSGATAVDAGWALVGNPYPSPLDYSLVAPADRANLDAAIYVFESTSQYTGSYRANVNGVGGNTNSPNAILAQGQGFFVRVSNGQNTGNLTLRNTHRITAYQNPVYHRTAETRPLVQLNLTSATGSDPVYVYFENGATTGIDREFDAVKLPNSNGLNVSAETSAQRLAIDALPTLGTATVTVPLSVGVPAAGSFSFNASQLLNLSTTPVYLRDRQTGAVVDLARQPSYSFVVSNASALITGRFELVFSPQAPLATAPAVLAAQVGLYPNPASKVAFVELPASLGRVAVTAKLVDALGRSVQQLTLPAQGAAAHRLELGDLAMGVYTLHLATSAGVVVKKLVVE